MRRSSLLTIAIIAAVAVVFHTDTAHARKGAASNSASGEFSFRLESLSGGALPTYRHGGYTYVEGRRGQRYAIRVFNHTGERVEAVVTVDGRSVVTGKEGNYKRQRGYVIDPYGQVTIEGFRTSWSSIAAFRFTDVEDSYAARMGNDSNVGVVGVAIFKEKKHYPKPVPYYSYKKKKGLGSGYGRSKSAPSASPPPSSQDSAMGGAYAEREAREQGIGTGYGEDGYSPATETKFERKGRRPNARMAIYYDDHSGLVTRGVIHRPPPPRRPIRQEPNPFPYSYDQGFAPPPPPSRHYWE